MATQVTITTSKKNIAAQKLRAPINLALACSKEADQLGLRTAMSILDVAVEEFKFAVN
jgi:hypothetical protein